MRNKLLIVILWLISCYTFLFAQKSNDLKLWYNQPANSWNEALPIGNGRLGAMIFGRPAQEKLQLNEETIWAGSPHNNIDAESKPYIIKVRELIFQEKYAEAQKLADDSIKNDINGMPYQPAGDLKIDFSGHENCTDYYRELDIEKAVASTSYKVDGTTYKREMFSSFADQVIIVRLTADKPGSITCNLSLVSPQKHQTSVQDNKIILSGMASDHEGVKGKVKFNIYVQPVLENGKLGHDKKNIIISNADRVTIYISIATNFINYKDISGNPEEKALNYLQAAMKKDFDQALVDHIAYYSQYFDRVSLNLGINDSIKNPTDIRIQQFKTGNDPQLAALYFQFGRYLLISSSQPGGQPATLQGIWNDRMRPPWESKYTVNINLEMNYWPAEITNLTELNEPLFQLIKDLSVTGRGSASQLYDARGWVLHHNTDIWRVTGIFDRAYYGLWQTGSAWLTQHIWQHYLFTGDEAYLKEMYPVMKEAAQFYVDVLQEEPHTKWLVLCPSNSPEHRYLGVASASAGTTMDNQLVFDLFSNVMASSKILDEDNDFADTLKNLRARLAPMQIGKHNQLQEWLYDWDEVDDDHRHVSHLYGLYPGNQISPYRTPELFEAAKTSLLYRGDESTGWSMGWKVNLWARLLDGNHAYKLIKDQINPAQLPDGREKGGTYPNMFDAHPPFQIDGNFGCAVGIAEMLIQSHDGAVHVLPALPDEWPAGEVKGLKARGDFKVDLIWREGKVHQLTVYAELGGNLRIRSYDALQGIDGAKLTVAEGDNPNPLFIVNKVKDPIISPSAEPQQPVLKKVYEYDLSTEAGKTYIIAIDN